MTEHDINLVIAFENISADAVVTQSRVRLLSATHQRLKMLSLQKDLVQVERDFMTEEFPLKRRTDLKQPPRF